MTSPVLALVMLNPKEGELLQEKVKSLLDLVPEPCLGVGTYSSDSRYQLWL